jgi:uncharacterized protein YndB with AHSA1/START domain
VTTTRVTRHLAAPRARVYAALVDPASVSRWRFPEGMSCEIHEFDAREGGRLRVSLTYDDPANATGKTSARTDTYIGRFERLVPDELVVEVDEFETDDPAFSGAMTMAISLADATGGGTDLVAIHEGVPNGVRPEDNELGWRQALDRLAGLTGTG